jgi:hypothetical protein
MIADEQALLLCQYFIIFNPDKRIKKQSASPDKSERISYRLPILTEMVPPVFPKRHASKELPKRNPHIGGKF